MKKSEARNKKRVTKKEINKSARSSRHIGQLAMLFSIIAIAGAGYVGFSYWQEQKGGTNPQLPVQVVPVTQQIHPIETTEDESIVMPEETMQTEDFTESISVLETITEEAEIQSSEKTDEIETELQVSTEPETSTEAETLSEADRLDRALRKACLDKFEHLGIVYGVNNYLNMRESATTDSEIVGKIFANCGVDILEDSGNGWYKIRSGGVEGYVAQQYIKTGEQAEKLAMEHCRYQATIKPDILPIYTSASESAPVLTNVVKGDRYDVISYAGTDWVNIEAVEGADGYVRTSDVSMEYHLDEAIVFKYDDSISDTRINIINEAFSHYGGKYVFGGHSFTDGIDCSSFTYQIYKKFGIDLVESYSITQSTVGKKITEAEIRPGDLLFYVGRFAGQIGHVAIYIGDGKIIHAASERKGICVSNWKYVPIVTIRDVIGDR